MLPRLRGVGTTLARREKPSSSQRRALRISRECSNFFPAFTPLPARGACCDMSIWRKSRLGALLERLEMGFEGGGILTLSFEFGLQFLDEKFEAQNFTSYL